MKHTVHEFKLAGGAGGLVVHVPGSSVVSLQVRFNSGYQFAPEKVYEVPHVMEHLLANVTKRHSEPNAFNIEVTKNGAYMNAHTSATINAYVYECAEFEFDRIVDLLEEQLTEPFLEAAPLAAEVSNVREELSRNITQYGSVCAIQLGEAVFPGLIKGYEQRIEQLPAITVAEAREHYAKTHTAANARFIVAGNFADGGKELAERLDLIFAKLPVGERLVPSRTVGRGLAAPVVTKREIAQLYYRAEMYFGELSEAERRALWLWRVIETGGFGSRILGAARRQGLAYHVSGLNQTEPGKSMAGMAGYVTPEHARPLFELIVGEVAAARCQSVGDVELAAAKDLIVGTISRQIQTPSDLLGWYIERYDETDKVEDVETVLELIRAVRPEEIQAVAVKAAAAGRLGLSFVGPVDAGAAGEYAAILASMAINSV